MSDQFTKTCSVCKLMKPVASFGSHKGHKDGLQTRCKLCLKETAKKQREDPHYKALDYAYRQRPEYKSRDRARSAEIRKTAKGKKSRAEAMRRYRQSAAGKDLAKRVRDADKQSGKLQARYAVSNAIKKKIILKAKSFKCAMCEAQASEYHHYLGYEKEHWLAVVALCKFCHMKADAEMRDPRWHVSYEQDPEADCGVKVEMEVM